MGRRRQGGRGRGAMGGMHVCHQIMHVFQQTMKTVAVPQYHG